MRCAIMQPTYLPWAGYFNLISQVDKFVFLDDVQFEKRSWQSRNRVILNKQITWLTVPVSQVSQQQIIRTVELAEEPHWRNKHVRVLEHAYAKHPYKHEVFNIAQLIADTATPYLVDLNIVLIKAIAERLGLSPKFFRASDLAVGGKRSEHLFRICETLQCEEYLSPVGSAEYLAGDGIFDNGTVRLFFQDYVPQPYMQKGLEDFVSHLSIIDVAANIGWAEAAEYIKSKEDR